MHGRIFLFDYTIGGRNNPLAIDFDYITKFFNVYKLFNVAYTIYLHTLVMHILASDDGNICCRIVFRINNKIAHMIETLKIAWKIS